MAFDTYAAPAQDDIDAVRRRSMQLGARKRVVDRSLDIDRRTRSRSPLRKSARLLKLERITNAPEEIRRQLRPGELYSRAYVPRSRKSADEGDKGLLSMLADIGADELEDNPLEVGIDRRTIRTKKAQGALKTLVSALGLAASTAATPMALPAVSLPAVPPPPVIAPAAAPAAAPALVPPVTPAGPRLKNFLSRLRAQPPPAPPAPTPAPAPPPRPMPAPTPAPPALTPAPTPAPTAPPPAPTPAPTTPAAALQPVQGPLTGLFMNAATPMASAVAAATGKLTSLLTSAIQSGPPPSTPARGTDFFSYLTPQSAAVPPATPTALQPQALFTETDDSESDDDPQNATVVQPQVSAIASPEKSYPAQIRMGDFQATAYKHRGQMQVRFTDRRHPKGMKFELAAPRIESMLNDAEQNGRAELAADLRVYLARIQTSKKR